MFQLERTSDEEGVLRVGLSRKLNEENSLCDIAIPAEGMLYPIVRLSKEMQTYTFVPLDRVRADGVYYIFTDVFTITFTVHPTRWTMFRNIGHPTRWTMCRNMPTPLGGQLYVTLST